LAEGEAEVKTSASSGIAGSRGKMKLKKLIIAVISLPLFLLLAAGVYVTVPWLILYTGIQSAPNPPLPKITYGEFPFRLEYELDGERKVIEDTVICEFDGFGSNEGSGKYRKWKNRLASGDTEARITLLQISDTKKIVYYAGSADYYMGDQVTHYLNNFSFPNAVIYEGSGGTRLVREEQLLNDYHIKLISWDYTQPILNSFDGAGN
jgi:hypothetical protein